MDLTYREMELIKAQKIPAALAHMRQRTGKPLSEVRKLILTFSRLRRS